MRTPKSSQSLLDDRKFAGGDIVLNLRAPARRADDIDKHPKKKS
jgi:hypothetical protein